MQSNFEEYAHFQLASYQIKELLMFSRALEYSLENWIKKEPDELEDFTKALSLLHTQFKIPYPIYMIPSESRSLIVNNSPIVPDLDVLLQQFHKYGKVKWTLVIATVLHYSTLILDLLKNNPVLWVKYKEMLAVQTSQGYKDLVLFLDSHMNKK